MLLVSVAITKHSGSPSLGRRSTLRTFWILGCPPPYTDYWLSPQSSLLQYLRAHGPTHCPFSGFQANTRAGSPWCHCKRTLFSTVTDSFAWGPIHFGCHIQEGHHPPPQPHFFPKRRTLCSFSHGAQEGIMGSGVRPGS